MLPATNSRGLLKVLKREQLGSSRMLLATNSGGLLKALKREQLGSSKMLPATNSGGLLKAPKREQLGSSRMPPESNSGGPWTAARITIPPAICSAQDEEVSFTPSHSATAQVFNLPGMVSFFNDYLLVYWVCALRKCHQTHFSHTVYTRLSWYHLAAENSYTVPSIYYMYR